MNGFMEGNFGGQSKVTFNGSVYNVGISLDDLLKERCKDLKGRTEDRQALRETSFT